MEHFVLACTETKLDITILAWFSLFLFSHCAIPEKNPYPLPPPPPEGIEFSWRVGGSVRPKKCKKCMKLNWNFQRIGGSEKKTLPWGMYGYFLNYTFFLSILVKNCCC